MPQLRTCGSPMSAADVADDAGSARGRARWFVDLAMGRPGADRQVVVRLDDAVQAGDVADVDEQRRLRQSELDQRQEAVAAGQQLRLALPILEDPQRLVQARRTDVVELAGNHALRPSSPLRRGRCRPVQPGRAQSCGDDRGPGRIRQGNDRGPALGTRRESIDP